MNRSCQVCHPRHYSGVGMTLTVAGAGIVGLRSAVLADESYGTADQHAPAYQAPNAVSWR